MCSQARIDAVPIVLQRLNAVGGALQIPDRLPDTTALQTGHELIRADDVNELLGISERLHVSFSLLKLLRQRVDLSDLVVDHLDVLREIGDVIRLAACDRCRIDDDQLRACQRCRQ